MNKLKERQNRLLNHYFTINENVATLKLVYDTFAELVNPNFGDDRIEKLNDKLFSDVREAVSLLPFRYKLDLQIVIKDFGDYDKSECEKIITQNIELAIYRTYKEINKKRIIGWALIAIGAVTLLLSYLFRNQDNAIVFDLINISGTLFVWEGVNTAFIEKKLEIKAFRRLARTIHKITIESDGNS